MRAPRNTTQFIMNQIYEDMRQQEKLERQQEALRAQQAQARGAAAPEGSPGDGAPPSGGAEDAEPPETLYSFVQNPSWVLGPDPDEEDQSPAAQLGEEEDDDEEKKEEEECDEEERDEECDGEEEEESEEEEEAEAEDEGEVEEADCVDVEEGEEDEEEEEEEDTEEEEEGAEEEEQREEENHLPLEMPLSFLTLRLRRQPKFPRKSAPRRNKLDHYAIIKFPLTTESAMKKIQDSNTLVFIVDVKANEHQIRQAVKKLYDIDVAKTLRLQRQPKYPRKSAPRRNKLDHYAIIKFPLTTESAVKKTEDNTLVFFVDIKANKHQIKQTVKKLYDIDVAKNISSALEVLSFQLWLPCPMQHNREEVSV
ncbi:hypothetical protein GH733_017741 [Mirounga leonina]|nr:hypothetical protein GH733_017741 [Mirounga leonina]